jgi:response regulator RpfG family c-di-GMP phosphodiesterase
MNQVILIVDSCPQAPDRITGVLGAPYEIVVARDGQECLTLLPKLGPDLVLLELGTACAEGYRTCRGIKESPLGEFTPVIAIGVDNSEQARIEAYRSGADDFVARPIHPEELLAKVRVHFRLRKAFADLWKANQKIHGFNQELEHLVAQRTADVLATRDVAVFALAKLAESRDPETGAHLERMQEYCQIVADELNSTGPYVDHVGSQFLQDLYHSSPLHDVGKVGIPDAILLKPTRLTPEEFLVMQRHTHIGATALERAARHHRCGTFLDMAIDIARHHHERFDGRGYPDGLRGEVIPLPSRIVALGDVFDAMTSWRSYKPATPPEEARRHIQRESGKHFDPNVVEGENGCLDSLCEVNR